LTLLAGANSSGKSSLLQAVLFLAQSFSEPVPVLNGNLVRLGEPRDVIRDGGKDLTLSFRYPDAPATEPQPDANPVDCCMRVTLTEPDGSKQLVPAELTFSRGGENVLSAVRGDDSDHTPQEALLRVQQSRNRALPEAYVAMWGLKPSRLIYRADLEALKQSFDRIVGALAKTPLIAAGELIRVIAKSDPVLAESVNDALRIPQRKPKIAALVAFASENHSGLSEAFMRAEAPDGWASETIGGGAGSGAPQEEGPSTLAAHEVVRDLSRANAHAARFAKAVMYLGPLRDEPRVAYPLGHTVRTLPVGGRGEFTAAYLQEHRERRVSFVDPDGVERDDPLPNAVSVWCKHLGIADRVSVLTRGKLGHQLGLQIAGTKRDPTAIGVGASQLLPVVVLVLGAPDGAAVLLEQPELHLHPKVQSRLGDFLSGARPGIRLIVETHSEYLVTRIRLLVVQGRVRPSDLSVMFATQGRIPGQSGDAVETRFRRLDVDGLGNFDEWPDDFFDSLDRESVEIARAVAERVAKNG
jgi:hypothetical protein